MPWGNKSSDDNQAGMSKAGRRMINKTRSDVSREAKRRVQQERKAGKYDGNGGKR